VFKLRTTSYDIYVVRHRTMSYDVVRPVSSDVAVIEDIDLTALFTYRTMSYDIATTPVRHGNLHVGLKVVVRLRTTSSGVVRSRPTSCVKVSSAVVRFSAQCAHRFKLCCWESRVLRSNSRIPFHL